MLETVDDGDDFEMSTLTDALKVKATSSHQYNVVSNITVAEKYGTIFFFFYAIMKYR